MVLNDRFAFVGGGGLWRGLVCEGSAVVEDLSLGGGGGRGRGSFYTSGQQKPSTDSVCAGAGDRGTQLRRQRMWYVSTLELA
jgi:hypothetical protein